MPVLLCLHPRWYFIIPDVVSGRITYAPLFDLRAISLCFYTVPPGEYSIILDQMSGRIAYTLIFYIRPVILCFYILPPGG